MSLDLRLQIVADGQIEPITESF